MADGKKIKVLVVDDSALMREALRSILTADNQIDVIAMAKDGSEGVEKALTLKPDVITMDLKMPLMGGMDAIKHIMEVQPIPIIVVSSLDTQIIVKALAIGAMDFVAVNQDIENIAKDLIEKIKISSHVKPVKRFIVEKPPEAMMCGPDGRIKVVCIGVSTGGPQALQVLLGAVHPDINATIIIVQHMTAGFINGLCEWLSASTKLNVSLAKAGDVLKPGHIYIAPDSFNMEIDYSEKIVLSENIQKNAFHVPSIDVMMKSAAKVYGSNVMGIILTGMGRDGVEGIAAIRKAGGITIAQDEKTSVIYGMNRAAVEKGLIDKVIPLDDIGAEIMRNTCAPYA